MGPRYFPTLDKCLTGTTRLVSWKDVSRAISENTTSSDSSNLELFLIDDEAIEALNLAASHLASPSSKSATDFQTKTAPINISQTSDGTYNLEQLKNDATWLSKEFKFEELVALRIAIVEWQNRPANQLLHIISSSGGQLTTSSALSGQSAALSSPATTLLDFEKEKDRRHRLVDTYFSERLHLLKVAADLVGYETARGYETQTERRHEGAPVKWIQDLAKTVTNRSSWTDNTSRVRRLIRTIGDVANTFKSPTDRPAVLEQDASLQSAYFTFQHDQLVHLLRMFLSVLHLSSGLIDSAVVMDWYAFVEDVEFLQYGLPNLEGYDWAIAQYLVSIISLDILRPNALLQALASRVSESAASPNPTYVEDRNCLTIVSRAIYDSATQNVTIAAPAVTAWSVITSIIQDIARQQRDSRDRSLEYHADSSPSDLRLTRRDSRGPLSLFERIADTLIPHDVDDTREETRFLLAHALDQMKVFTVIAITIPAIGAFFSSSLDSATALISRSTFLNLLGECLPLVNYGSELIDAMLAILTPNPLSSASVHHTSILAQKVLLDESQFGPIILDQALARYPYELSPMLRLFTAVASAAGVDGVSAGPTVTFLTLNDLNCITQMVPESFRSYELEHEDDNANLVVLSDILPIFATKQDLLSWNNEHYSQKLLTNGNFQDTSTVLSVPAGSLGVLVKETRPFVIKLDYRHSGLEFLGLLLSTFRIGSELIPAAPQSALDRYQAAEAVALFTALLDAALKQDDGIDEASAVLSRLGSALSEHQDIIYVVSELLDSELLAFVDQDSKEGSLELVSACLEFFLPIVKISPERVWAVLSRSTLLGVVDGAVSLASVVGGFETQIGQYRFLKACVELHALLVEDAVAGLVKRKSQPSKPANRFDSPIDSQDYTPDRAMSLVLDAYQRVLLDVLQNIPRWKFVSIEENCVIIAGIINAFVQLLESTYGISLDKSPSLRLTNVLSPAAEALLTTSTSQTDQASLLSSLGKLLHEGLATMEDQAPNHSRSLLDTRTRSILRFVTLLVRAASSGVHPSTSDADNVEAVSAHATAYTSSVLEFMPVFAALLASANTFRKDIFALLSQLVKTAGSADSEPTSILGRLSSDAAKAFLELAIQLDGSITDSAVEGEAWHFLTAIMTYRQQWCAMYLLTGTLPKDRAQRGGKGATQSKPLFRSVLDQLSHIATLSPERAVGMLKFVAAAQQSWAWASNELRSHPDFLKAGLGWLDSLHPPSNETSSAAALIIAREYEMAASICEIIAVNLHASLEIGDKSVLKALMSKFEFISKHSTAPLAYNNGLHKKLAENLARKFANSELTDFRRTPVNPAPLGAEFCYNRDLATTVLRHDKAWHGADASRNQGFFEEFGRANINLSLVHAQVLLLNSVKALATTLCDCIEQDDSAVANNLAAIARNCLLANARPRLDEPTIADVLESRLDTAFVILSRLQSNSNLEATIARSLVLSAWELVRTSPVDYDVATAASDFQYYRKLLQILYLAIQLLSNGTAVSRFTIEQVDYLDPAVASCVVSIVCKVVASGFRALCGNLHNSIELAQPGDFSLLTAILQASLAIPGINSVYALLTDDIANSSIVRGALSLYSWSDQLAEVTDHDPVYGDVAIKLLLALSDIPAVAEQMAIEGALTQIGAANLSNYYRKAGGKGPFDEPVRMFSIWTEGILPLCLNLLDAVGPAMASEVANFLNSLPKQLSRSEKALQNEAPSSRNPHAGTITLGLAKEAHSLSMLATILRSDVARAAAEGILASDVPPLQYDLDGVIAIVEGLTKTNKSFVNRIRATNQLEQRWDSLPLKGTNESMLQVKVMKELSYTVSHLGSDAAH